MSRSGQKDVQEVGKGRKEGRPQAGRCEGGQTAQDGAASRTRTAAKPMLLSGGNPQIAKAYGDAPVQAYIAAMPGWKRAVGRRLDALIVRTVPGVHKAVKWNSPLYGVEGQAGSSASIASRSTSRWRSSADVAASSAPRRVQAEGRAYSTSTRTTRSTRSSSPIRWRTRASRVAQAEEDVTGICEVRWRRQRTPSHQPASPVLTSDFQVSASDDNHEDDNQHKSGSKEGIGGDSPSQLIDARIKELKDWRGETLARVRTLIKQADPEVVEEVKWRKPSNSMRGVPVWSHAGMVCTGETYKNAVKMTFAKGACWGTLRASSTPASKATPGVPSISTRATRLMKRREGAHSRRRGTEHVGASYRSPRPLSEETKERLRSVVMTTVLAATWGNGLFVVADQTFHQEVGDQPVRGLVSDGRGGALVIVGGKALCRRNADGEWRTIATSNVELSCCVAVDDTIYVGTDDANVLREVKGTLQRLEGFDAVAGKTMVRRISCHQWPSGRPTPGIRSIAATCDGAVLLANVHVGGIPRSTDSGVTWQPTIDIDSDVHQVYAHPTRPDIVIAAAAIGLCIRRDSGATWTCEQKGLHASYCSAVAFVVARSRSCICGPLRCAGRNLSTIHRWGRSAVARRRRTAEMDRRHYRHGLHRDTGLDGRGGRQGGKPLRFGRRRPRVVTPCRPGSHSE